MARTISMQAVIDWIRLQLQGSAPASPAAGYGYLYSKTSDKHLYWKDESGTETDLMDITAASTTTVTGKTINLTSNTLTGTTAQFNTALSDGDFATLAGSETLTNKVLTTPTIADFTNAQHDHGDEDDGGAVSYNSLTGALTQAAGVYNPTRSAEANLDSNVTMTEAQYLRLGATVTVSGRFTADPTAAGAASFEITLPVASNLGAAEDVAGVAFCGSIAGQGAEIIGVAANDTAKVQWIAVDTTSQTWSYTFSYQVI